MIRTAAAAFAAIMLAGTAGASLARAQDAPDATRKERVEKINERLGKRFAKLDANKDGAVDRAETAAVAGKAFDRLDKNHDGALDASEIKNVVDRARDRNEKAGGMIERRLQKADADKDGKLTREEFAAAAPAWFARADADKDGRVTKAELDALLERREKRVEVGGAAKSGAAN